MRSVLPILALAILIPYAAEASRRVTEEILVVAEEPLEPPEPALESPDAPPPQTSQYESGYEIPFLSDTLGLLWVPSPKRPKSERIRHCQDVSVVHASACF